MFRNITVALFQMRDIKKYFQHQNWLCISYKVVYSK